MGQIIDSRAEDAAVAPLAFGFFTDFLRFDDAAGPFATALVDSSGGSASGTLAAISSTFAQTESRNSIASLNAQINKVNNGMGGFVFTSVSSGTFSAASGAQAVGGWVRLSGAATTDDSGGSIQTVAGHTITPGKPLSIKTRAILSDATESDFLFGWAQTDTSVIAGVTDGVYFLKSDGGTTISCVYKVGSVAVTTTLAAGTLAPGTFTMDTSAHHYGISIISKVSGNTDCAIEWTIDGVVVHRVTGVTLPAATVILAGTVGFQSGTASGTIYTDLDYFGTHQVR